MRQFHGCYSISDDTLWGVVRARKSAANTVAALKSIRAARRDTDPVYVILDNLSAHKAPHLRDWATRNNVELCFTPTYSSWANPIEAHRAAAGVRLVSPPWRNANARDPLWGARAGEGLDHYYQRSW